MCNHAAPERPETGREGPLYRWSVAFFRFLGYTVGEVIHMNKERLGAFIGERRRELGLTQKDLAGRLHVTDKAVSKWERGLSYPDVTLLEPLAGALGLNMEELMACRRQERRKEETPMKEQETVRGLLDISRDSVRRERRRSWQRLGAVLVLLAVTAAVAAYSLIFVRESDDSASFLLAETIGGENYVYLEMEGNHLLKLRCGENARLTPEDLTDQGGDSRAFRITYRYNRLTLEGELLSCEWDGTISLGGPESMIGNVIGLDVNPETGDQLFGYTGVTERCDYAEGDPFLRVPVFTYTFSLQTGEKLLTVEDVVTYIQTDWDNDGESELAVRTIWAEKPYTVYDYKDGTITETWPDTVDGALAEQLMTAAERQAELERQLQGA